MTFATTLRSERERTVKSTELNLANLSRIPFFVVGGIMFKFQEKRITPQARIVFLCGTKYGKKSESDKRNVLKKFLETDCRNIKALILEEHFSFGKAGGLLSYDDIFMNNLRDIEELSAAFADNIIIIHDSISTGAELAAFASNAMLESKICVLEPDSTGIEERKISAFLELAFFHEKTKIHRITYYPEVFPYHISKEHIEKHTRFAGNEITPLLGEKIKTFLGECDDLLDIKFRKAYFGRVDSSRNIISYSVEDDALKVNVSGQVLLYQVIDMMSLAEVRTEVRKPKKLYEHVDFVNKMYCQILRNSIEGSITEKVSEIHVYVKENKESQCESRKVVGYSLYMMQALGLIELKKVSGLCRISVEKEMEAYWDGMGGMLVEEADDALRGLLMDE